MIRLPAAAIPAAIQNTPIRIIRDAKVKSACGTAYSCLSNICLNNDCPGIYIARPK
ncbi:MAG TPA: hypothetical protein VKY24_24760 [Reyranella sp.]|nr:hypothetical protein [Reyranella sp.]